MLRVAVQDCRCLMQPEQTGRRNADANSRRRAVNCWRNVTETWRASAGYAGGASRTRHAIGRRRRPSNATAPKLSEDRAAVAVACVRRRAAVGATRLSRAGGATGIPQLSTGRRGLGGMRRVGAHDGARARLAAAAACGVRCEVRRSEAALAVAGGANPQALSRRFCDTPPTAETVAALASANRPWPTGFQHAVTARR